MSLKLKVYMLFSLNENPRYPDTTIQDAELPEGSYNIETTGQVLVQ